MCETNAYIRDGGKEEIYMEGLSRIEVDGNMLLLTGVFGDKKSVNGRITEVNFQGGRLIIERL